jgi:hypothetical protein
MMLSSFTLRLGNFRGWVAEFFALEVKIAVFFGKDNRKTIGLPV